MSRARRTGATVADVARAAGVSVSTAARALGGYGSVSAAKRAAVDAAAARVGYRRNSLASSMVTGRTQTLAFVGADLGNEFFARALRGVTDVARARGFEVLIANSDEEPAVEKAAVEVLDEKRVDGFVIAPADPERARHIAALVARGTPVVFLDRMVRGVRADAVLIDNVGLARAAVARLCELGHRRIALVSTDFPAGDRVAVLEHAALDPQPQPTAVARSIGYVAALRGAGLQPDAKLICDAPYRREAAVEAVSALLRDARPTAVFSTDNLLTLAAYEAIQRSGLRFPGQISLFGFDDLEWMTVARPTLSVVAQPSYDLGATAARRLLARLAGDDSPPQLLLLDARLVERDSTAPPEA